MKIALLGYGRMGKTIDRLAQAAGHEVVLRSSNPSRDRQALSAADVAVEFSRPESALENIELCLAAGVPVVSGTTGWLTKGASLPEAYGPVVKWTEQYKSAFFYSSNFSLGVNVFFRLNQYLAKMLTQLPDYAVELTETHHVHKLDAPSGTAITLAEGIIANTSALTDWQLVAEHWPERDGEDLDFKPAMPFRRTDGVAGAKNNSLPITSVRTGETPGTHRITYASAVDTLRIEHEAHGREGFAKGALAAAEWLVGRQGIYGMDDLLNI